MREIERKERRTRVGGNRKRNNKTKVKKKSDIFCVPRIWRLCSSTSSQQKQVVDESTNLGSLLLKLSVNDDDDDDDDDDICVCRMIKKKKNGCLVCKLNYDIIYINSRLYNVEDLSILTGDYLFSILLHRALFIAE